MKDKDKAKKQLIDELTGLRRRIKKLESLKSKQRQRERVYKESEEKYRTLIEQSFQAIVIIQDFRIVFANRAFAKISGYTVDELLALRPEKVKAMVHSEDQALVWGRLKDRFAGRSLTQHYEYRGIQKDRSVCWLEMYANHINYNGKPAIQAAVLDITERKQAEEALILQSKFNELRADIWKKASDLSLKEEKYLIQALLDTIGPAMDVSRTAYLRFLPERKAYVTELQWHKKEAGATLGADISLDIAKHFSGRDYIEIPKDIDKVIRNPAIRKTVKLYVSSKLKKHHIKSYLVVPYGDTNNPKGLFTFSECERYKEWSDLEKKILSEMVNILSLKIEQMNADNRIRASLREKEVLLQEIHHRVKNNMQIISSLINLQSKNVKEERILETFKSTQNRVKSMALIHERLYRSEDFARIDFAEYVKNLTSHLFHSFGTDHKDIKFKLNIGDILLNINTAIPCGLIVNELVSNSLKHAFPNGKKGKINITIHPLSNTEIELIVSDNGIGLPEDIDFRKTESLGLHLVTILAEGQLQGKIKLDRKNGTSFHMRLRLRQ